MKIKYLFLLFVFSAHFPSAFSQSSYDLDVQLGASYAPMVEQQMGLYYDDDATSYIQALGARLTEKVRGVPFKFQFTIVDSPEPNAFAIPGGHVYVTRGILSVANNEQELAGVIGHEIIHVLERHTVQQMQKSLAPSLLKLPGALVGKVSPGLGALINAPLGLGSKLFMANYGRGQEREADKLGIQLAARSGYNPQQLAVILTNLSDQVKALTGNAEKVNYFSDHPFTPKRADYINKSSVKIDWKPLPPIAEPGRDFLSKFDGMYFGSNPAQGVFQDNKFLHPDLGIFIDFPEGWTKENNPQAVAAADKEGNGLVYLTVPDTLASPAALGALLDKRFEEKGIQMDRSEEVQINGNNAYLIDASEATNTGVVNLTIVFVDVNGVVFQMVGVATDPLKDTVSSSLNSIRSLTGEEQANITGLVLRVEAAEEGESLEAFNERTGNEWNASFTALMNNIPEDVLLKKGQYLKTVRSEAYVSN